MRETFSLPTDSSWHQGVRALSALKAVIYTLILRHFEEHFEASSSNRRVLDFLKILFEPLGHVLGWSMLRMLSAGDGNSLLSSTIFILLGVVPWLFTYNTLHASISCIKKNRNLLFFRQIKPCDFVIATVLTELIISVFIFCTSLLLLSLGDNSWTLCHPIRFFTAILVYIILVFGFALIIACLGFFSKMAGLFTRLILRALYLLSGIFYSAQAIPDAYRNYFTANPLFQIIEISRECFIEFPSHSLYGDLYYLTLWSASALFIGFGLYIMMRRSILVHIMSE